MPSFIIASQIYLPNRFLLLIHKTNTAYIYAKNTLSLKRAEILKMLVKKDFIFWKEENLKKFQQTLKLLFVCFTYQTTRA